MPVSRIIQSLIIAGSGFQHVNLEGHFVNSVFLAHLWPAHDVYLLTLPPALSKLNSSCLILEWITD